MSDRRVERKSKGGKSKGGPNLNTSVASAVINSTPEGAAASAVVGKDNVADSAQMNAPIASPIAEEVHGKPIEVYGKPIEVHGKAIDDIEELKNASSKLGMPVGGDATDVEAAAPAYNEGMWVLPSNHDIPDSAKHHNRLGAPSPSPASSKKPKKQEDQNRGTYSGVAEAMDSAATSCQEMVRLGSNVASELDKMSPAFKAVRGAPRAALTSLSNTPSAIRGAFTRAPSPGNDTANEPTTSPTPENATIPGMNNV